MLWKVNSRQEDPEYLGHFLYSCFRTCRKVQGLISNLCIYLTTSFTDWPSRPVSLVLGMSLFVFVCVFVCLFPFHDIYLEASFWLWDHMISFQVSHWATLPHCRGKGGRDRQITFVKPNKTANKQRRHVFMESTYWVAAPLGFTASLTGLPSLATQTETYSLAKNRKLSGILRCEQRRQKTGDELNIWVK